MVEEKIEKKLKEGKKNNNNLLVIVFLVTLGYIAYDKD